MIENTTETMSRASHALAIVSEGSGSASDHLGITLLEQFAKNEVCVAFFATFITWAEGKCWIFFPT